jgi:hypothetical protein
MGIIRNIDAREGGDHTLNFDCENNMMETSIAAEFQTGFLLKKKSAPPHIIPVEVYMSLLVLLQSFSYRGTKAPIPTGQDYSQQKYCPFNSLPELFG